MWTMWKKINLHWFCTQNHILEPFSVRHACTKSYVTSEPYPRASQIWCQNVRETWKKKVMKEECEILSGIDAPLKKRQGGGHNGPPPPGKLGLRLPYFILLEDGISPCCRFRPAFELPSDSLNRSRSPSLGEFGRQIDSLSFLYRQESDCLFRLGGSFPSFLRLL